MSITISLPAYNSKEYIGECIKSCLDQTVKAKEIIVVDDASTDITSEIIKSYPVKYVRNKQNRGIGYSRARGVQLTKTKYSVIFSADDYMEPDFNEIMLRYNKKYPRSFLYCQMYVCDQNLNIRRIFRPPVFNSHEEFIKGCLDWARRNNMFTVYNMFGPTKLWQENNFDPDKTFGEDLEHLLRCILIKKIRFNLVPVPLFRYREHLKQMSCTKARDIRGNNLDTFKKISKLIRKNIFEIYS